MRARFAAFLLTLAVLAGGAYAFWARPWENGGSPPDASAVFSGIASTVSDSLFASSVREGMIRLEKFEITSTNETSKALIGGVVTFHASISGFGADGNPMSAVLDDRLEVSAPAGAKSLGHSSYAVTGEASSLVFTVSVSGRSRTFTYEAVSQQVANTNVAVLVNKVTPPLPSSFRPPSVETSNGHQIGTVAGAHLTRMIDDAKSEGVSFYLQSGFRSYASQESIYKRNVAAYGPDQNFSAAPGYSEHQTGFVADISCPTEGGRLEESFAGTPAFRWLSKHCWEYGFVLRYPKDREYLTGYTYEPWHYRYIGLELARLYHEEGWETLDEFLSIPR